MDCMVQISKKFQIQNTKSKKQFFIPIRIRWVMRCTVSSSQSLMTEKFSDSSWMTRSKIYPERIEVECQDYVPSTTSLAIIINLTLLHSEFASRTGLPSRMGTLV